MRDRVRADLAAIVLCAAPSLAIAQDDPDLA